jgi:hypothetical protein
MSVHGSVDVGDVVKSIFTEFAEADRGNLYVRLANHTRSECERCNYTRF